MDYLSGIEHLLGIVVQGNKRPFAYLVCYCCFFTLHFLGSFKEIYLSSILSDYPTSQLASANWSHGRLQGKSHRTPQLPGWFPGCFCFCGWWRERCHFLVSWCLSIPRLSHVTALGVFESCTMRDSRKPFECRVFHNGSNIPTQVWP